MGKARIAKNSGEGSGGGSGGSGSSGGSGGSGGSEHAARSQSLCNDLETGKMKVEPTECYVVNAKRTLTLGGTLDSTSSLEEFQADANVLRATNTSAIPAVCYRADDA